MKKVMIFFLIPLSLFGQQQIKPLTIGDKFPEYEFKNVINYTKSNFRITDFKGKAIIIDFWAPWCSPCIAAFPKIDSLQRQFKSQLQFIAVTRDSKTSSEKLISSIRKAKAIEFVPSSVEDTLLSRMFTHVVIPHYVWIDSKGKVKAITGPEEITKENVQRLVRGEDLSLKIKDDSFYDVDSNTPFFAQNPYYSSSDLLYHSVLTKFTQGFSARAGRGLNWNWIRCTRHPSLLLFKMAFGEFDPEFINNNRVILEGFNSENDSLQIGRFTPSTRKKWYEMQYDYLYNYELVIPDSNNKNKLFELMQDDLNRYFGAKDITAKKETRKGKVYALVQTSNEDRIKSRNALEIYEHNQFHFKVNNQPLESLIGTLQTYYVGEGALPIEDNTGYKDLVSIEINTDLSDINAINKALERYNLKFVEKEKEMEMIVITKRNGKG